jgi:L-seryl-tRNA(Ser) seleniumtransferase
MPTKTRSVGLRPEDDRTQSRPPSVDIVLRTSTGKIAIAHYGHQATANAVRATLASVRDAVQSGVPVFDGQPDTIAAHALSLLERNAAPSLRPVFNLTGTILHTNLGRARLPDVAIEAAIAAMRNAVALEYDIATGQRGERDDHVRGLVKELTGAEDAIVVNNNAAAVLLVLNTFANGKEAIVSRGELIEIGGAFRLPDIMKRAGCRLVEVGTTNRTHPHDYDTAITAETGLVMKAHTSNYVIQGFTTSVGPSALAQIARARSIPFINDLGSGAIIDLTRYGLAPETTVREAIAEGADVVTFSGDKLLGGPQVGIVAGRAELIKRVAKNPMKRALRVDKVRLAILEATLKLYRNPDRLSDTLPTIRFFARPRAAIVDAAKRVAPEIAKVVGDGFDVSIAECSSQIGSGAAPVDALPSAGISISAAKGRRGGTLDVLASAFRGLPMPVIGRITNDCFVLDLRCLDDEATFVAQLHHLNTATSKREA